MEYCMLVVDKILVRLKVFNLFEFVEFNLFLGVICDVVMQDLLFFVSIYWVGQEIGDCLDIQGVFWLFFLEVDMLIVLEVCYIGYESKCVIYMLGLLLFDFFLKLVQVWILEIVVVEMFLGLFVNGGDQFYIIWLGVQFFGLGS